MAKIIFPIFVISLLLLSSCHKDEATPSFESRILGNWLVVDENYGQTVTIWGLFYITSVKLYPDKSFKLNLGDQQDSPDIPSHGTWELVNDESSIVFYTVWEDLGTTYRDTTEFNISLPRRDRLVLKNGWANIVHKQLNN